MSLLFNQSRDGVRPGTGSNGFFSQVSRGERVSRVYNK